jgi:hypothetical protein
MAWGKAGSSTTPTTSNVSVTGISANDTLQSLLHITTSGQYSVYNTFNDVSSGTLYHGRYETNGTTDQTYNQDRLFPMLDNSGGSSLPEGGDIFNICYIVNLETEEKLVIGFSNMASSTTPKRNEYVGKFANTSDKITSIENFDPSRTAYTSDSNLTVLGSDITPAAAITFPSNVQVGSRAEITDTRKMYNFTDSPTFEDNTFSSGWTTDPTSGSEFIPNTSTNVIDWNVPNENGFNDMVYYDVCRCR